MSEFFHEVERLDLYKKIDCVNFACFINFEYLFATRAVAVRLLGNKFFLR